MKKILNISNLNLWWFLNFAVALTKKFIDNTVFSGKTLLNNIVLYSKKSVDGNNNNNLS